MGPRPPKRRKRRSESDDEDYIAEESSVGSVTNGDEPAEECDVEEEVPVPGPSTSKAVTKPKCPFLPYSREDWSPLYLYRTMGDLTAAAIRQSGSEGIGRIEVGKTYGINTHSKSGNRKVSTHILNVMKAYPGYFGQYQKMEGKFRCIKYYWKVASHPDNFSKLFARWESIVGSSCPFKMGQVIKFPDTKLSTLRISDVSLRRLIDIMELVLKHRVLVTMARFTKMLIEADKAHGSTYQIDKKSAMKCLIALQKKNLLKIFDTVVQDENISNTIQVICESSIMSPTDPEVTRAIRVIIDEYHEGGRVFPNGQLRFMRKESDKIVEENTEVGKDCDEELAHLENELDRMTIEDRLSLLRLQNSRMTSILQPSTGTIGEPESGDTGNFTSEKSTAKKASKSAELDSSTKTVQKSPEKPKPSQRVEDDVAYGRQSKWNRVFVIHKLAYHFVHGQFERQTPTVFERFPPGKPWTNVDGTRLEDCPVYVDEESPYRFVPPMPQFSGVQRGWFMIQDLLMVMPLSVFTLVMRRRTKSPEIEECLKDPVRRHTLISDLPRGIRSQLLSDKMPLRQLEHYLLILCGLGLARLGRGESQKKVIAMNSQFYYITKGGMLRDTSTSKVGYANVTLPIEQYDAYHYSFDNLEDVEFFWHHLRAVAFSTNLAFKGLASQEDSTRVKKYAIGSFDKTYVYKYFDDFAETALPALPHDGCAGFDSAFFIHLKRHWDLIVRPPEYVDWFVAEWRRSVDRVKVEIERRVRRLEKAWNSYLKSLLPPDSNKVKETVLRPTCAIRASERKALAHKKVVIKEPRKSRKTGRVKKKRLLDELDVMSAKSRLHFRARFSNRERDMESRNKTVQSLMDAGVREMVRPQRVGLLRQIVKNLSSFKEMRELRAKLASGPARNAIEKRQFFYKAFEAANRNLALESKGIPPVSASNEIFDEKVMAQNVKITTEALRSTPLPARSVKPTTIEQIRHCVAFNIVTAILLSEKDLNDRRMDAIVEQVSACSLSSVLEQLRVDGLLARLRPPDEITLSQRGQTVLSNYFRHFFDHRFHNDIVEMSNEACRKAAFSPFTEENSPGIIVAALKAFSNEATLDVSVPGEIIAAFEQLTVEQSTQDEKQPVATKQLRSLEKADMHIESTKVVISERPDTEPLPDVIQLLDSLSTAIPVENLGIVIFEDFILNYPVSQRAVLRKIYKTVEEAGIVGASLSEVVEKANIEEEQVEQILQELVSATQLFAVGVDCYRYVTPANSTCWLVHNERVVFFPTPWMEEPSGTVHYPIVRWISEGVLFTIIDKPGISMKDLKTRFSFVLQPRILNDVVNLLSKCGCVKVVREKQPLNKLSSPFANVLVSDVVEYVIPTLNAMNRYAKLFGAIKLSEMLAEFRSDASEL